MIQVAMTPEQFAAKAAELKEEQGIDLTGTDGVISKDGVTANWLYHEGELSVTITHKPFYIGQDACESRLKDWLTS